MNLKYLISLIVILIATALSAQIKLSLNDFGWDNAKTGVQRAKVLYDAQTAAVKQNATVDYSGVGMIELEITREFKSIPLTGHEDFQSIEFVVRNNAKDVALFELSSKGNPIDVYKQLLDGNLFSELPELRSGEYLLVIKDNNLWVDNRVGYNYGHTRKDILLIKDGVSLNTVIAPYNNNQSSPSCTFIPVYEDKLFVQNFTLTRVAGSQFKTSCLSVQGIAHLMICRITINTPENDLSGDNAIHIQDCADITLKDIAINNTYSQPNRYGYGININNAWNTKFINVRGDAPWGLLGNNNMSDTYLSNCVLNRFDIHCYGRNVFLSDCTFDGGSHGWYCGGSSIYGTMRYDRCIFVNCTPITYGDSYKTAVGMDVVFNDCVINASKKKNHVFSTKVLNGKMNPRMGLGQKCLPDIVINNMTINVPNGVKEVLLYDVGDSIYPDAVGYLQNVKINGLEIRCQNEKQKVDFKLISTPVLTNKAMRVEITNLKAPTARVVPRISRNKKNKVKLSRSSLRSIDVAKGVRIKTVDCIITK